MDTSREKGFEGIDDNERMTSHIAQENEREIKQRPNSLESSIQPASHTNQSVNNKRVVSLSSAGVRALLIQVQALYLRAPVKLFRPSRFDYLSYVRLMAQKHDKINLKPYRFSTHSSIGMLVNVIRKEGWDFIPKQVLPPLIANSATGIILYSTYLTSLDYLSKGHRERISGPIENAFLYSYAETWKAGLLAGAVQSLAAAPVDAIYTRLSISEILDGKDRNLWTFGARKLRQIGVIGVFAGYGYSLVKESLGFAFYFSTFETIKTRGYLLTYNSILTYRKVRESIVSRLPFRKHDGNFRIPNEKAKKLEEKRFVRILHSTFILLAGASAAFILMAIQYPMTKIQNIHLSRLETLDLYNAAQSKTEPFIKLYYKSYITTYHKLLDLRKKTSKSLFQVAYKGFGRTALMTMPSSSVGLLVFEIMRTKMSDAIDDTM